MAVPTSNKSDVCAIFADSEKTDNSVIEKCDSLKCQDGIPPVKRLAPEILSEIFVLLSYRASLSFFFDKPPWVLGRVCSQWRTISRSDPRLWGNPCIFMDYVAGRRIDYHRKSSQRALEILPPVVTITLHYDATFIDPKLLYPHLHRCKTIAFWGSMESFHDFYSGAPPNAFENLDTICISKARSYDSFDDSEDIDDSQGTQSLALHSSSSFEPFPSAPKLQKVQLRTDTDKALFNALKSIGIPYSQIDTLELFGDIDIRDFSEVLQQCQSVTRLTLGGDGSIITDFDAPFCLPELRELRIVSHQLCSWIRTMHSWENLTVFILCGSCSAEDLQEILHRCRNVQVLNFVVPTDFPLRPLTMPVLRSITATYHHQGGPFKYLTVPCLEQMIIKDHCELDDITTLLETLAQCPLSDFRYHHLRVQSLSIPMLRNLITPISPTIDRALFHGIIFDASILHDIGSGRLFPQVSHLACDVESATDIVDMMEARVARMPVDHNQNSEWKFTFSTVTAPDTPEGDRLKKTLGLIGLAFSFDDRRSLWRWEVNPYHIIRYDGIRYVS